MRLVFVGCVLLLIPGSAIGACSSSGGGNPGGAAPDAGCTPYQANADLTMSTSFARDVIPVFVQNCAVGGGTCHGEVGTLPFLGLPEGSIDPTLIHDQIVGVKSGEDPTMDFVTAGDPANSYLMHKVDGDACTLAAQCTKLYGSDIAPCGATMPFLSPQLPADTRDKVRAWIAQGAMND